MADDKKEKAAAKAKAEEPRRPVVDDQVLIAGKITNVLQGDMCMIALEVEMPGHGIVTVHLHPSQFQFADTVNIGGDGGDKQPH
jgi:hypothetical protein